MPTSVVRECLRMSDYELKCAALAAAKMIEEASRCSETMRCPSAEYMAQLIEKEFKKDMPRQKVQYPTGEGWRSS